jgi:drug/metabolite transporter (DMT)-like permease
MLAAAACFITNVLLIRALGNFGGASVWLISSARFVVGLVIVLALYRRAFQPSHLFKNPKLIERGLVGGLGVLGYYYTVAQLGAGRATFINNTYVIWGALLAVWILRERIRPALLVGAVITLVGLSFLTHPFDVQHGLNRFDALALLIAIGSGWIVVTIRQLHHREHTSTIFAAQCVYGLLLCAVPAFNTFGAFTLVSASLLLIASVCAACGQLLMTHAFRALGVAEGSLLLMLVPLGIATGSMAFFGEHFTPFELLGGVLILAGSTAPALIPARRST